MNRIDNYSKLERKIILNLKEFFNDKFYNDLVKCDFLKDIEELISGHGIINIDLEDFVKISNGSEIVGSISQVFDNLDDEFIISRINDKIPTDCVFNITGETNLKLTVVDKLLDKLRGLYPDISIIFGTNIIEEMGSQIKVQALLTCVK